MAEIGNVRIGDAVYQLKDAKARTLGSSENPLKLPFCVEKDGVRYSCDIVQDAEGIDWDIRKI